MKRIIQYASLALLAATAPILTSCQSTPTRSTPSYTKSNPKVKISNNRNRSLGVRVEGPETRFVYLTQYDSETITLKPGAYRYAAVSKNTKSSVGTKYFAAGKIYDWKFSKK